MLAAVGPGDLVVVKGSNGSNARLIAAELAALGDRASASVRGAA